MRYFLATLVVAALWTPTQAGFSVNYTFTNTAGNQPVQTKVITGPVTAIDVSRGPGLSSATSPNSLSSSAWNQTMFDLTDYYAFTITPGPGYGIHLTNLSYTEVRTSSGPVNFVIRTSLNSFTSDVATYTFTGTSPNDRTVPLSLSGTSLPLEVRLYGWGGSAGAGTYRLTSNSGGLGLQASGIAYTPAPPTLLLLASALPLLAFARRLRRAG